MKLNKSQEAELMHVYNTWWNSYLNGDVKTYNSFLADDYHFVGSFDVTAYQLAGKAELRNVTRKIEELVGGLILITDLADAYVVGEPQWVFYSRFRFTSLMQETEHGWRLIYQHFSAPDTKAQEGETLGTEQITKENQELRDAVKRRTVELEHKSRELEIEASLERVRAVAMDNGNGIPNKILDKIFQPFFTTKPTGQGTGLGLSLSYDIIKAHGGELQVKAKEGEGSEFIIQLSSTAQN